MATPICLIKVDNVKNHFGEIYKLTNYFTERLPDYFVIVVPFEQPEDEYYEPIQLQVFYEKDFTEIQHKELKDMIQKYIDESKKTETKI